MLLYRLHRCLTDISDAVLLASLIHTLAVNKVLTTAHNVVDCKWVHF